jgi:hypothetical protein
MPLREWLDNGWLKPHVPTRREMADLLAIVDRDLPEAAHATSHDWHFGIAYNAALKLCAMLLHAEGYRAANTLQHYRTIMAMPVVLGSSRSADADYLDNCRRKRNELEYERAGVVSEREAGELVEFCRELRTSVLDWLKRAHPPLCP